MNGPQRIEAAVALEPPDRVPLAPLLDYWAATYTGISNAELLCDSEKRFHAVMKTALDFSWDMTFLADTANLTLLRVGVPARLLIPGIDLPEASTHQFEEKGFMHDEDFDLLERDGFLALSSTIMPRIYPDMTLESALIDIDRVTRETTDQGAKLRDAGIEPAAGFVIPGTAFDYFCFARSINVALMDLRRRPDRIRAAAKRYCQDMLELAISSVQLNGIKRVFIGLSRSSPVFVTA
ncbi:MAG: hypothetical protein RRA35_08260, partial [Desulfomonilia bacterium]|nr:hypothetical protein [Desulfomonilia bacterium]